MFFKNFGGLPANEDAAKLEEFEYLDKARAEHDGDRRDEFFMLSHITAIRAYLRVFDRDAFHYRATNEILPVTAHGVRRLWAEQAKQREFIERYVQSPTTVTTSSLCSLSYSSHASRACSRRKTRTPRKRCRRDTRTPGRRADGQDEHSQAAASASCKRRSQSGRSKEACRRKGGETPDEWTSSEGPTSPLSGGNHSSRSSPSSPTARLESGGSSCVRSQSRRKSSGSRVGPDVSVLARRNLSLAVSQVA